MVAIITNLLLKQLIYRIDNRVILIYRLEK